MDDSPHSLRQPLTTACSVEEEFFSPMSTPKNSRTFYRNPNTDQPSRTSSLKLPKSPDNCLSPSICSNSRTPQEARNLLSYCSTLRLPTDGVPKLPTQTIIFQTPATSPKPTRAAAFKDTVLHYCSSVRTVKEAVARQKESLLSHGSSTKTAKAKDSTVTTLSYCTTRRCSSKRGSDVSNITQYTQYTKKSTHLEVPAPECPMGRKRRLSEFLAQKMVSTRSLSWTCVLVQLVLSCACFLGSLAIIAAILQSESVYPERQFPNLEWWSFCLLSFIMIFATIFAMFGLSGQKRHLMIPHLFLLVILGGEMLLLITGVTAIGMLHGWTEGVVYQLKEYYTPLWTCACLMVLILLLIISLFSVFVGIYLNCPGILMQHVFALYASWPLALTMIVGGVVCGGPILVGLVLLLYFSCLVPFAYLYHNTEWKVERDLPVA